MTDVEHPGARLRQLRRTRVAETGETRRASAVLSREVLARRTGVDGYVVVSAETIKAIEAGTRNPGDDTIAALFHGLRATDEEWPSGALAETRYLVSRWLSEEAGMAVALKRRSVIAAALAADPLQQPVKPEDEIVMVVEAAQPRDHQPPQSDSASSRTPGSGQAA